LGARVLTDLKLGAAFPTDHRLHSAAPGFFLSKDAAEVLRSADVVLSLDWVDLAGTLKQAWGGDTVDSRIIQVSVDQYIHNGWSMDHQGLPPVDLYLMSEPAPAVGALIELVQAKSKGRPETSISTASNAAVSSGLPASDTGTISIASLARTLRHATEGSDVCLIRLPLGWNGEMWDFRHPLDYLGYDGGGGIGSGPGMAVGAALALKGTGRLPVAIIGDGDYMMGVSALWTAANARIPLLIIVSNNRSFFNDEVHQERVAKDRNRPVENRWIGQRIADPEPDLATIARGQGVVGIGPVEQPEDLDAAIAEAVHALRGGKTVVVDVRVTPGYSASMSTGMTRSHAA
jgi:thiamine pyrophosphate-dependent acetolactate synthase large subunit-like protein